jgi:uncharacterized protein YggE
MYGKQSWKWAGIAGLVLFGAVAIAGLTAALIGAQSVSAGPLQGGLPSSTITVYGFGEATGSPDVAYVSLGVDVMNEDLGAAMTESDEKMTAIVAALGELGIAAEDMQTANFSVWSDETQRPEGAAPGTSRVYRVNNILQITVRDITRIQAVIDDAIGAGANTVHGLTMGLDDPAALEHDARIESLADARDRASQIAEAIGVTLGEPIIVNEGSTGGVFSLADARASMGMGGGIQEGQLSVSVQVEVTFEVIR